MSAATETMNSIFGVSQPRPGIGVIPPVDRTGGAYDVRRAVRAGLMDALDYGPGESVHHLAEIGWTRLGDSEFDVVTADLDVVHRADPERIAADLLRICRPGGRIGLACPTPGSFLAQVQQTIDRYMPESRFAPQPVFVGTRENLNALFEGQAIALGARDRVVKLHYSSAEHWLAGWQSSYAPLKRAYQLVDPDWRDQFSDDLLRLANRFTEVDGDGRFFRCEYLEFLVHKGPQQ